MADKLATYSVEKDIAIITIDNPPMNPLTAELREQLVAAFDELDSKEDEIRVVILTGRGKAFMAGADIKSFPELTQEKARGRLK
jgi:enoyl-CoA hydratase/carnithine racemase